MGWVRGYLDARSLSAPSKASLAAREAECSLAEASAGMSLVQHVTATGIGAKSSAAERKDGRRHELAAGLLVMMRRKIDEGGGRGCPWAGSSRQ